MRLTGSEGSTYITGSLKYVYNTITGSTGKFTAGSSYGEMSELYRIRPEH